ncbi:hypothetical protein [Streptomyces goshikiensis]|uniref:hypothetical protein n=1 Tax=Streptomyces goshikiensis TaxID=1942 RepID=UPI0036B9B55E
MTGPEHYREAERLLGLATDNDGDFSVTGEFTAALVTGAQVHATLALAAATALIDETPRSDCFANYQAWQTVAGAGEGR